MLIPFLVVFIAAFMATIGWQRHEMSGAEPRHKAVAITILGLAFLGFLAVTPS